MPVPIQDQNRGEIRRSIGRNLGICIVGAATSTVDKSSLTDAVNLRGGDDEHNQKQVMIYDAAGSIVDGEIQFCTDYDGSTSDATTDDFTANITTLDKYEMWDTPWFIGDINDVINQAINEITKDCLIEKQVVSNFTVKNTYEYNWLSSFKSLDKLEYVTDVKVEVVIDLCEVAWTSGTGTTTTADSSFQKEGNYCSKNVAVSVGTTTILCYEDISSIDISLCDKVEFDMYSSIALTAGQLQIHLDDTAAIASGVEKIDIPAMTAATWYRHSLSLANPHLDTAIISVGIYQVANVADFTFYIDNIRAVKDGSKVYKELNPQYWEIVRDSTNYLKFTTQGIGVVGTPTQIRLNGLQNPARLDDDTTDSTIDPQWIIDWCTGRLLIGHAKSSRLDIDDKAGKAKYYLGLAEKKKTSIRSEIKADTRWV